MDRKNYSRPFMAFEKFTPQEFVAACYPAADLDGSFHFDLYTMGEYGKYDGANDERLNGAWGPAALKGKKGASFKVDVYRWCTVDKPVIQAGDSYPGSYTANHTPHRWATDGPNGGGETWEWYDGYKTGWLSSGWNSSTGHFVQVAIGATLQMSASGLTATLIGGDIPGVSGTSAS